MFDLDQLPAESVVALRDSVMNLLVAFASGPRPIQTQLCVCLASLAIQMLEWKDVLASVGSALGGSAGECVLEFLKILPEEVTEGRKINLSVRSAIPLFTRSALWDRKRLHRHDRTFISNMIVIGR